MGHSAIPPQVTKLLPLLASDKDGEVIATARAICRTLGSAGLDLHDLVKVIASPPVRLPRSRRSAPSPSWQAPHGSANSDADLVTWCRQRGDDWLPLKDRTFLAGVEPRLRDWGGVLSSSQRAWLHDIRNRIEAREAA